MYGTAFGIGNPYAYSQQQALTHPFGLQTQPYGQQLANIPFGITSPQFAQAPQQLLAQWLQLVPQQLQQLQRLEYLQQQQLVQLQQLLQLVPQQLQQLQQLIQVLPHQIQQLQQQSPTLQPFGQSGFGPIGAHQPGSSALGWFGSQTPVM